MSNAPICTGAREEEEAVSRMKTVDSRHSKPDSRCFLFDPFLFFSFYTRFDIQRITFDMRTIVHSKTVWLVFVTELFFFNTSSVCWTYVMFGHKVFFP